MAIGNLGAVKNLLEGFIASEFGATSSDGATAFPVNQGLAILPEMVERIASRADLTESNLRVTAPRRFDGTNDVTVESGAVKVIAAVISSLSTESEDEALILYEAAVTEGTTRYTLALNVNAGECSVAVFPEPIPMAALFWSVVDNGSDTDIEGTSLGTANATKVMLVYAE